MDSLYPRVIVDDFARAFRFYEAVLPALLGAELIKGTAEGPYANWDVADQAVLVIIHRSLLGGTAESAGPGDRTMFTSRVESVDEAYALCLEHGGTPVSAPVDRPEWGPNLRTAHVRDPEGNLWELQSY